MNYPKMMCLSCHSDEQKGFWSRGWHLNQRKEQWFNTWPILHNTFPGSHPSKVKSWRFMQIEQNYAVVSDKTVGQCVSKSLLVSAVWSSWNQGHSCHVHCKDCTDATKHKTRSNYLMALNGKTAAFMHASVCAFSLPWTMIIVILVLTK